MVAALCAGTAPQRRALARGVTCRRRRRHPTPTPPSLNPFESLRPAAFWFCFFLPVPSPAPGRLPLTLPYPHPRPVTPHTAPPHAPPPPPHPAVLPPPTPDTPAVLPSAPVDLTPPVAVTAFPTVCLPHLPAPANSRRSLLVPLFASLQTTYLPHLSVAPRAEACHPALPCPGHSAACRLAPRHSSLPDKPSPILEVAHPPSSLIHLCPPCPCCTQQLLHAPGSRGSANGLCPRASKGWGTDEGAWGPWQTGRAALAVGRAGQAQGNRAAVHPSIKLPRERFDLCVCACRCGWWCIVGSLHRVWPAPRDRRGFAASARENGGAGEREGQDRNRRR